MTTLETYQGKPSTPGRGKMRFRNASIFFAGCALVVIGVVLNLKMYIDAAPMHFAVSKMSMDATMGIGMAVIAVGFVLAGYGVGPGAVLTDPRAGRKGYTIEHLETTRLTIPHWALLVTIAVTLIIDVMKPASLGFTLPGMVKEYGLTKATVAILPFSALLGTTIGSFLWGWYGDYIGRRPTILFSAILFVGTSVCGAMPSFGWNVGMCLLMGVAAGGLLPTAMALISELLPVRNRAFTVVIMGGIGAAGGYLAASTAATLLVPTYTWRILWLLNLPTGMLVIALSYFIPESPRYLLSKGRQIEASRILAIFSAGTVNENDGEEPAAPALHGASSHDLTAASTLFRSPYLSKTLSVVLFGFAWGLINYGFFLWLPTNLQSSGFSVASANGILAKSAVIAIPAIIVVAVLYSRWSSKRTMVLASLVAAVALLAFLPVSGAANHHAIVLTALIILALGASAGMTSTLSPYSTEVFPTSVRATGSGIAAGAGKLGGLVGIAAVLAHVTPTIDVSAVIVAIPVVAAMLLLASVGIETRGQRLEQVSGELSAPIPGIL